MNPFSDDNIQAVRHRCKTFASHTRSALRILPYAAILAGAAFANQSHALSCSASADDWGSGYVVNVTVTNDSSGAISDWEVTLNHSSNPQVTGSWNANVTSSGSQVTATNVSWNGSLSAGQSTSFGYQGSHSGNFQVPTCVGSGGVNPATPTPTQSPTPTNGPTPTGSPTTTPTPTPTSGPTPTPEPTPTQSPSAGLVIQENESGFCGVDGSIDSNNSGFTGSGFANTDNASGKGIDWSVNVPSGGNYNLQWRFANGSSSNRSGSIIINTTEQATVDFGGTGAWTSWNDSQSITVYLSQGYNAIRLNANTSGGLPNVDKITISGGSVISANCNGPTPVPTPTNEPTPTNAPTPTPEPTPTSAPGSKLRVMMSSDIGGTDNDDQQSMVHFLVYADLWDVEGLISSPWGSGRTSDILEAIDAYEQDYSKLSTHADYPTPAFLRSKTKQGATAKASSQGYGSPTQGSEWIAEVAMRDDPRPLWITVWGGIEDLAQALHDHPEIETRLRVYWIAGPNRRNSPNASAYIANNHKNLWIIEADETYRGFFNGGNMSGDLSNSAFPSQHVDNHGALGEYFMAHRTTLKMGDTPAVLYTIDNEIRNPGDPTRDGWGGAFIPCGGDRPNCWKDNPARSSNGYDGAATVNMHREAFLRDFQARMDRAQSAK